MEVKIYRGKTRRWFSPFAWIIRKNQKTKWNHYGICWQDNNGQWKVSDAKIKGIRVISAKEWAKEYELHRLTSINIGNVPVSEFDRWVADKIGTKYSVFQLIGIAMITCGLRKTNPFGKDKKYLVCHEYVLIMLARFLKIEIGDSDDYNFRKAEEIILEIKG